MQMQTYGDPPSAIVDEMTGGMPAGLMGGSAMGERSAASGDSDNPDDLGNFDFPPELKDKCPVQ
jgi:hypothetical protein